MKLAELPQTVIDDLCQEDEWRLDIDPGFDSKHEFWIVLCLHSAICHSLCPPKAHWQAKSWLACSSGQGGLHTSGQSNFDSWLVNLLHISNKLIESFAPSIMKSHICMGLAVLLISMNHKCGILRSLRVRLKRKHGCEQEVTAVLLR